MSRWGRRALGGLILGSASACGGALTEPTEWARVQRGELVLGVDVRGKLEASVSDSLGPPILRNTWEFKLARIAPEGSSVKQGEVVMAFDATELERQLLEKRNARDAGRTSIEKEISEAALTLRNDELAVAEARAKLQKAALKLERPSDLSGSLELDLARLDRRLAELEIAHKERLLRANAADNAANLSALRSRFARAEQRVTELESEIPRMQVTAPRAGTVVYVPQQNGAKKQVGDGVWWGERILKIAVLDQMLAKGEIDEVDVSRVRPGLDVTLRLEAHPDVECRGNVVAIGKTVDRAAPDNPSRVVRLDIDVAANDTLRPSPGMRFEGRVATERLDDRLLIPVAAVFPREQGPVAYRKTVSGFETVELTLGQRDRERVEVLAGLSPGDEVSVRDLLEPETRLP